MKKCNDKSKLDISDRYNIEIGLIRGDNFNTIAKSINRSAVSVSREIKRNRTVFHASYPISADCRFSKICAKQHVCGNEKCMMHCHVCSRGCSNFCDEYISIACHRFEKPPFVCNSCKERRLCQHERYFYSHRDAQHMVDRRRSESHKGRRVTGPEFKRMNEIVSSGIMKGQPLSHIMNTFKDQIPVSERTIYRYIEQGKMKASSTDLRRQVGYRKRRKINKNEDSNRINQSYRKGRSFKDFLAYMESAADSDVVEMDTVKGRKGSKTTLLTMFFRANSIMLIFLMPDNTQQSVIRVFDYLEDGLGEDVFKRLFKVFLTDNGSEFKDVRGLEMNADHLTRTKIFYCDPMASNQKGRIEKNHEYIRYVIPKGTDLKQFTEDDITILMNHINSTKRNSLNQNCPYDLIDDSDHDMKALMRLMGMRLIMAGEVCLNPKLLKKSIR